MSAKKATLTDVARRAGVSVTTASYILNGRSTQMRISAETGPAGEGRHAGPGLPAQLERPRRCGARAPRRSG